MIRSESPGPAPAAVPEHLARMVRQRQLRFAFENARFAILPLVISVLCYGGLLSSVVKHDWLLLWLLGMGGLICIRLVVTLRYRPDGELERWARLQTLLMGAIGLLYGITAFWVPFPQQVWQLAVMNLWLGGLAVGVLMGQGIVPEIGLAFAVPLLAPMMGRLLLADDATLTALGIGNLLFYIYIFSVVMRAQHYTLSEIHHRVLKESLAATLEGQRQRSEALVERLTREVSRRKRIQAALKAARDQARRQSEQDHLTELANRRTLERVLRREWARAQRERRPLSIVLCDIDRFRAYNERYGHHAGDLCLARVARLMVGLADGADDLAARFGGEEFAVLLPETGEYAAQEIAESIRAAVYELTILHGASDVERVVTASCGVATIIPEPGQRPEAIIESAALALKRAKAAGRNCVYARFGSPARDEL